MRKFLIGLICALCFGTVAAKAQTTTYRATEFAIGVRNEQGSITWDDWDKSNMQLSIDWDNGVIMIYSQLPQKYSLIELGDVVQDVAGSHIDSYALDLNWQKCLVRFRIQDDGTSQIYIFYNDLAWVYNIIKI